MVPILLSKIKIFILELKKHLTEPKINTGFSRKTLSSVF